MSQIHVSRVQVLLVQRQLSDAITETFLTPGVEEKYEQFVLSSW